MRMASKAVSKFLEGILRSPERRKVVFPHSPFQKGFDYLILSRKWEVDFHIILEAFQLFHLLLGTLGVVQKSGASIHALISWFLSLFARSK